MKAETVGDKFSSALADALDRSRMTNAELAERIGVNHPNVISQWKLGWRPMPARYAPKMAAMLGVRPEAISPAYAQLRKEGCVPPSDLDSGLPSGHVALDRLHGFCRENGPNQAVLPAFVVEMKLGNTPMEHVRWIFQPTGAMAPTIPQGSLVLLDSTRNSHDDVVDGELYAYELYGRPYVRRIQIGRNSWALCGHDAGIERVVIKTAELKDLKIMGLVLGWL